MAVTTKKVFTAQVQNHVIEILGTDVSEVLNEQLQDVINGFTSWYCKYEQKRNPNRYDAFKEWLMGLPSSLNVEFEYYTISQTLKAWFEGAGESYKDRDGDKEAALYYHLVIREFEKLCKKNGVSFF